MIPSSTCRLMLCVALYLGLLSVTQAGQTPGGKKLLSLTEVMSLENLIGADLSPTAEEAIYSLKHQDHTFSLCSIALSGGPSKTIVQNADPKIKPTYSPDGKSIAYLSITNGVYQLHSVTKGAPEIKLTNFPGGINDYAWSPDGTQIAFLGTSAAPLAKGKRPPIAKTSSDKLPEDHLYLLHLASKKVEQLTHETFCVSTFSWSPDGKHLAFAAQETSAEEDFLESDLWLLELATKKCKKLVERKGIDTMPKWAPDGASIAFITHNGKSLTWGDNTNLALYHLADKKIENLSENFDRSIGDINTKDFFESFFWDPQSNGLYFTAEDGVYRNLFFIETASHKVEKVAPDGVYNLSAVVGTPSKLLYFKSSPQTTAALEWGEASHFQSHPLIQSNPQLAKLELGQAEAIHWKARDGLKIEGILVKPSGYESGKRYPLVAYIHGGPESKFSMEYSSSVQLLASSGFAVLCPNPRGSSGYGAKFGDSRCEAGVWGGEDFFDIMRGIDFLIAQGIADKDRLGIGGWSYGGYMSAWAITQTSRFKAAYVGSGGVSLASMYGESVYPKYYERTFGGVPWERKDICDQRSPITYVDKISTPTLILHGEADANVPPGQAKVLYAALKRRGVPVVLVMYPGEGHSSFTPPAREDALHRIDEWFKERL